MMIGIVELIYIFNNVKHRTFGFPPRQKRVPVHKQYLYISTVLYLYRTATTRIIQIFMFIPVFAILLLRSKKKYRIPCGPPPHKPSRAPSVV